jgi:hypothetical protein
VNRRELFDRIRARFALAAGGEGPIVGAAVQQTLEDIDVYVKGGSAPLPPERLQDMIAQVRAPLHEALKAGEKPRTRSQFLEPIPRLKKTDRSKM